MNCPACKGQCPTPQACELPVAGATRPPRVAFLLADAWDRWPRITPALVVVALLAVWGFGGYLDRADDEPAEIQSSAEEVQP